MAIATTMRLAKKESHQIDRSTVKQQAVITAFPLVMSIVQVIKCLWILLQVEEPTSSALLQILYFLLPTLHLSQLFP